MTNYDLPLFKMFFCIYSEHDVNIKTQTEPQKSELNAHVIFDQIWPSEILYFYVFQSDFVTTKPNFGQIGRTVS